MDLADTFKNFPDAPVTAPVTRALTYDPNVFEQRTPIENDLCPLETFEHIPLDPAPMVAQCPMFAHAARTGGEGQPQGVWMNMALACTFLKDGHEKFHEWSRGYKGYKPDEAEAMWERKLAESSFIKEGGLRWPSCQAFKDQGCKQCATCPLKITSPLKLAVPPVQASSAAQQSSTQQSSTPPLTVFTPPNEIHLPPQYRNVNGPYGVQLVYYPDPQADEHIVVFRNGIVDAYIELGVDEMHMIWFEITVDKGRTGWVCVTNGDTGNYGVLRETLSDQNVKCNCDSKRIHHFMVSWLEIWHSVKQAPRGVQFGWLRDENGSAMQGFAYGGWLYYPDGTKRRVGVRKNQRAETYRLRGSEEPWRRLMNDVILPSDRPDIECMVAAGFAAPLMVFANLYNGVMYCYSSNSARGKSTAIAAACAVWASPVQAKAKVTSSQLGMTSEIAVLRNLPFFLDEVSEAGRLEAVAKAVNTLTEGGQEYKNYQDGTPRPRGQWQTTLTVAGNRSLWELIRETTQTDASLLRVLELNIVPGKIPSKFDKHDVLQMTGDLDYNYGHIGTQYGRLLAMNHNKIKKMVLDYDKWFAKQLGHTTDDDNKYRFWEGMSGGLIMGATLANAFCKVGFHIDRMQEYLLTYNQELSRALDGHSVVGGSQSVVEKAVNEFFRTQQRNTAWGDIFPTNAGRAPKVQVEHFPDPKFNTITIRFASKDHLVAFAKKDFDEYVKTTPYGLDPTMDGLRKHFGAFVGNYALNRGVPGFNLSREDLIIIPIPGPQSPWWNAMMAWQPNPEGANDNTQSAGQATA